MRRPIINILLIVATAALQGCNRASEAESRFLHDYKTVTELAVSLEQAPPGFTLQLPQLASAPTDFQPLERNVRDYMHSRGGWMGDSLRQMIFRPVTAQVGETNAPIDAAALLQRCFGRLERAGFTSGEVGFSKTAALGSGEVASKSWSNRDRTLIVLGQIITIRASGEIIASVHYWGTLNYQAR
jgi:hypothetical protein